MTWDICPGWDAYSSPTFCGVSFRSIGAMGASKSFNNNVIFYQTMSIRNPRSFELACALFRICILPNSPNSACSDGYAYT